MENKDNIGVVLLGFVTGAVIAIALGCIVMNNKIDSLTNYFKNDHDFKAAEYCLKNHYTKHVSGTTITYTENCQH